MRRFLAAIEFLTIVPVSTATPPALGAPFFPIVGAMLGLAAGAIYRAAAQELPAPIAALIALLFLIVLTAGLHEDGLADVFDAFRAYRPPERIHAILKDSRIGTFGALALALALLLRWQSIEALGGRAMAGVAAAAGASRGAMVAFAFLSKPAGDGLGKTFSAGLGRPAAIAAAAQAAALPFLLGPGAGIAALGVNVVAILAGRAYFHRRIGGVTGDCLGALCQISETLLLLTFACRRFT